MKKILSLFLTTLICISTFAEIPRPRLVVGLVVDRDPEKRVPVLD